MEDIKDYYDKKVCEADYHSGLIVRKCGKTEIHIRMQVGSEVMIKTPISCTIIFRTSPVHMQVSRMGLELTG